MRHLDVTIDLETLALSTNAAIVQIAAIPWNRQDPTDPFLSSVPNFEGYVDVRSCVMAGFDIEPKTARWWSAADKEVQTAVLTPPAFPLKDVLENLVRWIEDCKETCNAKTVCLWAQGSDFDIALLRNAFGRYELNFPVDRAFFRDSRTFILEFGAYAFFPNDPLCGVQCAEQVYKKLPEQTNVKKATHNAIYDAQRTTWQVWNILKKLQHLSNLGGLGNGIENISPDSPAIG